MAINLKPPSYTSSMQDNQFLKNPADDFLSGLHQNKAEMENKIANISAVSN